MKVTISTMIKEGAPLLGKNPLPIFRDRNHHLPEKPFHESMQERHKKLFGYDCAKRVLPYRIQDRYSRDRAPMNIKTAVLENEHLRATFYVEYGGRLTSLYDKDNQKELIYNNPVFQAGNAAILNAWLATGIEFNCSQSGHSFLTMSPLFAARVVDDKGQEFLRTYEYERCKGVFYQMDFHLPSGSKCLYMHARIVNPMDAPVSTYWWTNIDMPERGGVRVFSASDEVIYYLSREQMNLLPGYNFLAAGRLPYLDCRPGYDLSYPENFDTAVDYFFQIPETIDVPWEAAAYKDGFAFYEVSSKRLLYRKMFCWGISPGGSQWRNYLGGNMFEIQAGLAPTQKHGLLMAPHEIIDFTQAFGQLQFEPGELYGEDWSVAQRKLRERISQHFDGAKIEELNVRYEKLSAIKPQEILNYGSGFGALELRRRNKAGDPFDPAGMIFPDASIGGEESIWLSLLEHGVMPEAFPENPPASYLVSAPWKALLEASLQEKENRNWHSLLHYGIIQAEEGDFDAALKTFEESLACKETVWALRNIADIYAKEGKNKEAIDVFERLFLRKEAFSDQCFAEEYMELLVTEKEFKKAWVFYQSLSDEMKKKDRLSLQAACAAVEIDEFEYVEAVFKKRFAIIREGENSTTDVWFKYKAKMVAKERGIPYTNELLAEIITTFQPPEEIDFRLLAVN